MSFPLFFFRVPFFLSLSYGFFFVFFAFSVLFFFLSIFLFLFSGICFAFGYPFSLLVSWTVGWMYAPLGCAFATSLRFPAFKDIPSRKARIYACPRGLVGFAWLCWTTSRFVLTMTGLHEQCLIGSVFTLFFFFLPLIFPLRTYWVILCACVLG